MNTKQKISRFQISSSIFVILFGTLLHFTYNWSNNNQLIGAFSVVNESTWEHLKLIYFPMLITIIFGYFYLAKNTSNFICAKTIGLLFSILFTIVFFYTYTGILGTNYAIINIGLFFVSIILGEYLAYKIIISNISCNRKFSIIVLFLLFVSFILFTYITPKIGLFKDPITGQYGIHNFRDTYFL